MSLGTVIKHQKTCNYFIEIYNEYNAIIMTKEFTVLNSLMILHHHSAHFLPFI